MESNLWVIERLSALSLSSILFDLRLSPTPRSGQGFIKLCQIRRRRRSLQTAPWRHHQSRALPLGNGHHSAWILRSAKSGLCTVRRGVTSKIILLLGFLATSTVELWWWYTCYGPGKFCHALWLWLYLERGIFILEMSILNNSVWLSPIQVSTIEPTFFFFKYRSHSLLAASAPPYIQGNSSSTPRWCTSCKDSGIGIVCVPK